MLIFQWSIGQNFRTFYNQFTLNWRVEWANLVCSMGEIPVWSYNIRTSTTNVMHHHVLRANVTVLASSTHHQYVPFNQSQELGGIHTLTCHIESSCHSSSDVPYPWQCPWFRSWAGRTRVASPLCTPAFSTCSLIAMATTSPSHATASTKRGVVIKWV